MFEDDIDGNGIPCDHPLRWFHRLAAWAHERIERMTFIDRQKWHDRLPDWVCEAYERIEFDYPCRQCEDDRYREYGVTTPDDETIQERWRERYRALMEGDHGGCPGGCGGRDCCGGHECGGDCDPA